MPKKYKIKAKVPWIGYPGSLIQQNYAEALNHGYFLWDIEDKDKWNVSFESLKNVKPFVTVDWNQDINDIINVVNKYPQGFRLRIRSDVYITQREVKEITDITSGKVSELTFKIDAKHSPELLQAGLNSIFKNDIRNIDVLIELIKQHHNKMSLSEDDLVFFKNIIQESFNAIEESDSKRNIKWSLKKLVFDNLFSYGENNEINFENLNGLVGVFGKNRIGKSSLVGALLYTLYNSTDRGPIKNSWIVNLRKQYSKSKIVINVGGCDYVIERNITKKEDKKKNVLAITELNLYKILDDGTFELLKGDGKTDTEKVIRNLIGNVEDFLLTGMSTQGDINQFISHGSTKRRQFLSKLLDLDLFEKMYDYINLKLNQHKQVLKTYTNYTEDEFTKLVNNSKDIIEKIKLNMSNLTEDLDTQKAKQYVLLEDIAKYSNKNFVYVTQNDIDNLESNIKKFNQQLQNNTNTKEKLEIEIKELTDKINKIILVQNEYDISDIKKQLESLRKFKSQILLQESKLEKENNTLNHQKKSLKLLDEVPCKGEYPTCKFIKDAANNKTLINDQLEKINDIIKQIDDLNSHVSDKDEQKLIEMINKIEVLNKKQNEFSMSIVNKKSEINTLSSKSESINSELSKSTKKLEEYKKEILNKDNEVVYKLKSDLNDLNKQIKSNDSRLLSMASEKGKLESDLEKIIEQNDKRVQLINKMRLYELVCSAFSKKGIPNTIVSSQLPVINAEIAKILQGIVDFTVELEIDDSNLEVYINYGDSKRLIELCSGMEKFISSLSIRVALINISSLPKPDVLVIDEGFGSLDDEGIDACNKLLGTLTKYFKSVIIVSHVDGIKESVDQLIEVTKKEKDSYIYHE